MANPKTFKPADSHRTTFARMIDKHVTVSLYGKVLGDLGISPSGPGLQHPEGSGDLRAGQVYGYSQNDQCFRFPTPRIYMLPDPVGAADGCGWDPAQYVVWKVPAGWTTIYFEVRSGAVAESLVAKTTGQQRLTADQCLTIASDCVFDETGNPQDIDRSRTLRSYGINSPEQASGVRTRIVGSSTLGVQRYGFQIDSNALKDLSGKWTLGQLTDRIQDTAVPALRDHPRHRGIRVQKGVKKQ